MFNLSDPKHAFLLNEILTSSINAGLQTRNRDFPVYKKDLTDLKKKEKMIMFIREFLLGYMKDFDDIDEAGHKVKIGTMAKLITEAFGPILQNGVFRIGISQKIINLFLKYLWCSGWVKQPFHCPFDSIIKGKLIGSDASIQLCDWTKMNSIEEYGRYVKLANEKATALGCSIPEWEVKIWNRRNALNEKDKI